MDVPAIPGSFSVGGEYHQWNATLMLVVQYTYMPCLIWQSRTRPFGGAERSVYHTQCLLKNPLAPESPLSSLPANQPGSALEPSIS